MLTCNSLRRATLASALLLIGAGGLELLAAAAFVPVVLAAYTGFLMLLAGVGVLTGTALRSFLPGNAQGLRHCEH
jgi:hypothetical protein